MKPLNRRHATAQSVDHRRHEPVPIQVVDRYQLLHPLGRGGMGTVYYAEHLTAGLRAAVKLLHPDLSHDPAYRERFLGEAQAAQQVNHPGLVHIFNFGELPDGRLFLLMEYLAGETVRHRLEQALAQGASGLPVADVARILRQVAASLAAAHVVGVLHRDLKPENLMLVSDPELPGGERVKVVDFGIAKFLHSSRHLTSSQAILGTGAYLSPEQCARRERLDGASDVYSLGIVLYELLTGAPPFVGGLDEILSAHVFKDPLPLRYLRPEVPSSLEQLVRQMLCKEPSARPTMQELGGLRLPEDLAAAVVHALPAAADQPERDTESGRAGQRPAPRAPSARLAPKRVRWLILTLVVLAAVGGAALLAARSAKRLLVLRIDGPVAASASARRPRYIPARMIYIPGGRFSLGSTEETVEQRILACRIWGEQPVESCNLGRRELPAQPTIISSFFLDRYEVDNMRYAAYLNARLPKLSVRFERMVYDEHQVLLADLHPDGSGLQFKDGKFSARPNQEHLPVVQVTWDGAYQYCQARQANLPTEAQWEFAAKGAADRLFPWGQNPPSCDGVAYGRGSPTMPCAKYPDSPVNVGSSAQDITPEGVTDMAGNVAEWALDAATDSYKLCSDVCRDPAFVPHLESLPGGAAPVDGASAMKMAFRGCGYLERLYVCTASSRGQAPRAAAWPALGFRCAAPALIEETSTPIAH